VDENRLLIKTCDWITSKGSKKRKLGRATKPKSNLDQMIADLVETYGVSLLLAEMTIYETGAVGFALSDLFEKL
jgi:hypothetical protein